jgi:hypothetical protein
MARIGFLQEQEVEVSSAQYKQVALELQRDGKESLFQEGTDWVMFLGTTNAIFVAWTFSAYPEHMWLIFFVEALVLFALRARNVIAPKQMPIPGGPPQLMIRLFYMLEFCYYANYVGLVVAVVLPFHEAWFTATVAKSLFAAGFGVSGSLLVATAAFGNQLLFHDVDNTVSMLIHFFPALVFYTLRWHYERLEAAWPSLFYRGPFDDIALWDIFGYAVGFYMTWFVPYLIWMLCGGRRLPQNKTFDTCLRLNPESNISHDTVFHFNMRDTAAISLGGLVKKARRYTQAEWEAKGAEHDFNKGDIFAYMFLHACANVCGPVFSLILYTDRWIGGSAIAVVLILAIKNGSGRYSKMIHVSAEVMKLSAKRSRPSQAQSCPAIQA